MHLINEYQIWLYKPLLNVELMSYSIFYRRTMVITQKMFYSRAHGATFVRHLNKKEYLDRIL